MPEEQKQNKDKILVTKKGFQTLYCDGGYALYGPYMNTLENDMQKSAQQVNERLLASGIEPLSSMLLEEKVTITEIRI